MIDIISLLRDNHIPFSTSGKDVHKGWVAIKCPLCPDSEMHGGFALSSGTYKCWRCGRHKKEDVLSTILKLPLEQIDVIIRKYYKKSDHYQYQPKIQQKAPSQVILPETCTDLTSREINYLLKRNFDVFKLQNDWGKLHSTSPFDKSFPFRLICPIIYNSRLVSFQGRDITDRQKERYKACPKYKEVIHHKHILYGMDYTNGSALVVEGITDAWRLGHGAIATFGTEYTSNQVRLLCSRYKNLFILFDNEDHAQETAVRLALDIQSQNPKINVSVENIEGMDDPGSLTEAEARYVRKYYLSKF